MAYNSHVYLYFLIVFGFIAPSRATMLSGATGSKSVPSIIILYLIIYYYGVLN